MLELEKKYADLPWLAPVQTRLEQRIAAGECPHALLVHGRAGSGRRALALWLAEAMLGVSPDLTSDVDGETGHPDLCVLEPLVDRKTGKTKKSIGIDQIRTNLIDDFLHLTSHGSAGRLAIVWPAERMTLDAANCLLKSLEEPPRGVTIVLIAESLSRLPATIVSRCQRVRIPVPARDEGLRWLAEQAPGADLGNLLDFAGGAPLAALAWHESGVAELASGFAADLQGVQRRQLNPVEVAADWQKNPELALRWLDWRLAREVRNTLLGKPSEGNQGGNAVQACFQQMAQIRELRRLINGGINAELSIAGLLMDWYGGLSRQ